MNIIELAKECAQTKMYQGGRQEKSALDNVLDAAAAIRALKVKG